jgi:hypothetical protein
MTGAVDFDPSKSEGFWLSMNLELVAIKNGATIERISYTVKSCHVRWPVSRSKEYGYRNKTDTPRIANGSCVLKRT